MILTLFLTMFSDFQKTCWNTFLISQDIDIALCNNLFPNQSCSPNLYLVRFLRFLINFPASSPPNPLPSLCPFPHPVHAYLPLSPSSDS